MLTEMRIPGDDAGGGGGDGVTGSGAGSRGDAKKGLCG